MDIPARRVCVLGAGYVGLVTAVGLASLGHHVDLVEIEASRLEALRAGRLPVYEPGLEEAFEAARRARRLTIADRPVRVADAYLVCTGTPISEPAGSDLSQVVAALRGLAAGSPILIRSTMPPGGTERVLAEAGIERRHVLSNPEFLSEGTALHDFLQPSRIVIGTFPETEAIDVELTKELYAGIDAPVVVVDVRAAELIKNAAGAFLALRLSAANELAALCEAFGTDAGPVLAAIGLDPRIGPHYLAPSLGYGGSCLPRELQVLEVAAGAVGVEAPVLKAAPRSNRAHQDRFAERVLSVIGDIAGPRVALLGLAFKAGTDDVRGSPALTLARRLLDAGVTVRAFDPRAGEQAVRALPDLEAVGSAEEALADSDVCVIATEWPMFRSIDWGAMLGRMRTPQVVDGRRLLDATLMRRLGFGYVAVGASGHG